MHGFFFFFISVTERSPYWANLLRASTTGGCVCVCQCELISCRCVWETKSKVSALLFCSISNQAERLKRLLRFFNNKEQLSKLVKMSIRDEKMSDFLQCDAG